MPISEDERVLGNLIKNMLREDEDPLTPLIDEYYIARNRSKERLRHYEIDMVDRPRPPGRFSPSKIVGCERQAAFNFLGVPGRVVVDPEREGIFDDGKWRHHKWDATFLDMEMVLGKDRFQVISIEEDVEYEDLYVAGALDAVIRIADLLWVVDFKGINSWGFERVFKEGKPLIAHVLQLLSYMRARKIKRGLLLYEHKDKNKIMAFVVRFNEKQWREVREWCERVLMKMDNRQLPPMSLECQSGTLYYQKCPWAHICYNSKLSPAKIKKAMYKNFPGTEALWEMGKQLAAGHLPPDAED